LRGKQPVRSEPRRRCVGCGRIAPKSELLRVALAPARAGPARAVPDPAAALPGRGAYLCLDRGSALPVRDCAVRAARNRGIARTLRCAVSLDPELIESWSR